MLPHIEDFVLDLETKHYSPYTVRDYKRYLGVFDDFLNESSFPFNRINKQTIASYKAQLASRGRNIGKLSNHSDKQVAPCTINYKLAALRVYLRYLIGIDYPCPLAPQAVENLKTAPKQPQVPGPEDLIRLIDAPFPGANIIELRDKAILETLFHTGLRVSELASLNRDQLNLERKQIRLKGKGNNIRTLFLPNVAAQWISHYLQWRQDHFRPLFIRHSGELDSRKGGERMRLTPRSIQNIVTKYAVRCGLSTKATPQTLRHCFALYLAEGIANPVPLQVLSGHERLHGIIHYVHGSHASDAENPSKQQPLAKPD